VEEVLGQAVELAAIAQRVFPAVRVSRIVCLLNDKLIKICLQSTVNAVWERTV